LVTSNVRFWHASGIDASIEASGLKLNTESLVSVLVGGISFQVPPDGPAGDLVGPNAAFSLYPNKTAAFKHTGREVQTYLLNFSESLRGLSPGAPVDFRGIVIGEVKSISVEYDREAKAFRFPVEIEIYPERVQSRYRPGAQQPSAMEREPQVLLNRMVARGFRAQLKSANLLTGQLYVALDFFPRAPKASVNWEQTPPLIPTVPGSLQDIQETLRGIAAKLEKVPFDTIGTDLGKTLKSLNTTLQGANKVVQQLDESVVPEVRGTLERAQQAIGSVERTLSTDAPVQQDLRETLGEVGRAAQALRVLADYLSRHPEALIRGKREGE
jgi:paraquat-inducible protein B